jgi:hypothetical protein
MQLKCYQDHIGEKVPFKIHDSDLINKINRGLTSCWSMGATTKSHGTTTTTTSTTPIKRLSLGGRRKNKRMKKINKKNHIIEEAKTKELIPKLILYP